MSTTWVPTVPIASPDTPHCACVIAHGCILNPTTSQVSMDSALSDISTSSQDHGRYEQKLAGNRTYMIAWNLILCSYAQTQSIFSPRFLSSSASTYLRSSSEADRTAFDTRLLKAIHQPIVSILQQVHQS